MDSRHKNFCHWRLIVVFRWLQFQSEQLPRKIKTGLEDINRSAICRRTYECLGCPAFITFWNENFSCIKRSRISGRRRVGPKAEVFSIELISPFVRILDVNLVIDANAYDHRILPESVINSSTLKGKRICI